MLINFFLVGEYLGEHVLTSLGMVGLLSHALDHWSSPHSGSYSGL